MGKATVIRESNINTSIDMKLTMKDIIDIAIHDQQDQLEAKVESLKKEALKTITDYYELRDKIYLELGAPFLKKMTNAFGFKNIKLDYRNYDWKWNLENASLRDICVHDGFNKSADIYINGKGVEMNVSVKYTKKQISDIKKAIDKHNAIITELDTADQELYSLTKKGSRAKTALVKQMLATSEEGKVLLSQLAKTALLPAK